MLKNIEGVDNITAFEKGLGIVKLPSTEANNVGCYYTVRATHTSNGVIELVNIDQEVSCIKQPIDFIQLDVEGREFDVLKGAVKTIEEFSPLIMIEEKNLPQDKEVGNIKNAASDFLIDNFNYQIVETVHRDVILQRK